MDVVSEKAVLSKITWRLIPFLFVLYIIAYLDRANVGFARLEMQRLAGLHLDGLSWFNDGVFGFGAGIFFIGYFLFEVPSNLLLEKIGARIWIARIMLTWGLVAMAMLFVNKANTPVLFYSIRFLLGIAEAGFFPGVILYLTYWFTSAERARIVALFMTATALANAFGSPISGALLNIHVPPLSSWQWLFLLEGLPAVMMGVVVLFYLPNGPKGAKWLTDAEKQWIAARIELEQQQKKDKGRGHFAAAFTNPAVWLLSIIYVSIALTGYGIAFWMPKLIKASDPHMGTFKTGLLVAIPYIIGAVVMVFSGRSSDRTGKHQLHVAIPLLIAAAGFLLSAYVHSHMPSTIGLVLSFTIAVIGVQAPLGPFWALPTALLGGTAAAAGIAFVNSIGNLGGFAGGFLPNWLEGHFKQNGTDYGFYMLAVVAVVGALLVLCVRKPETVSLTIAPEDII